MRNKICLAILLFVITNRVDAQTYNIVDFGAKTDSSFLNTSAIQSAIEQCNTHGGGEVIVPAGTFYTGTVLLESNVYLRLMPGSVLQGSYDPADYPEHNILSSKKFGTITHNGLFDENVKAIVIADHIQDIGIKGEGTIRGAGEGKAFQLGLNKDGKPKNIFFIGCKGVLLQGIKVLNAAQVTISVSGCERVNINGLFVQSLTNWNCDGLDVDAKDVTISNCIIDSEDDALCFKSEYLDKFCENISVSNCVVSSICNGIKFGTGSRTGFRNFTIDNCIVKKGSFNGYRHWKMTPDIVYQPDSNSVNAGIVIGCVDGGILENINISNIVMTDVISPFMIRVGRRFVNALGKPAMMRHIRIQHVIAESRSVIPSIIAGLADSPIEDVQLSDIRISIPITVTADSLKSFLMLVPEAEKSYPENHMFGNRLPASAFYMRHVRGVACTDVSINYISTDARPIFFLDDVKNIRLRGVLINDQKLANKPSIIALKNSQLVEVEH